MAKNDAKYRLAEAALWKSVGVEPSEEWVRLPGGENVRVQIAGEGDPVLFIHGGSSSGANWAPLIAGMQGFRCLLLDRPGCGLSDPVAGGAKLSGMAQVETFADRLVADVLDALGVERSHLVSTSLGGYSAMRCAAAHPNRVNRVVEFTWMMGAPVSHAPMSMRVASIPGIGELTTKIPANRFAVKVIMKQIGLGRALAAGKVSEELIGWFIALLRHTNTMGNELRSTPKVITPLRGLNELMVLPDELITKINAPVLFVWGGEDPMGGEDVARSFAAKFNDARIEMLPLAGHAPWIDEPELCATLANSFLVD